VMHAPKQVVQLDLSPDDERGAADANASTAHAPV
jgi:hypothetical protein